MTRRPVQRWAHAEDVYMLNLVLAARKHQFRETETCCYRRWDRETEEEIAVRDATGSLWRHITGLNHKQFPKEEPVTIRLPCYLTCNWMDGLEPFD